MNCEQFKHVLLKHCNYKLTGEGKTMEMLESMEKDFDMDKLIQIHDCSGLNLRLVFEEAARDAMHMGKVFALTLFVGLVCKQRGTIEAAYELVDWLSGKYCLADLYKLYC